MKSQPITYRLEPGAYQEHVLSPRVLCFSPFEFAWWCKNRFWCCCSEDDSYHLLQSGYEFVNCVDGMEDTPTSNTVFERPKMEDNSRTMHEMFVAWKDTTELYSMRRLTKERDRLPALSGIAKRFQNVFGGRYLAGIWEQDLAWALHWYVSSPGKRS